MVTVTLRMMEKIEVIEKHIYSLDARENQILCMQEEEPYKIGQYSLVTVTIRLVP